jgi:CRP/FNR family transcriptional regulator, cyclic AMP receptor protein
MRSNNSPRPRHEPLARRVNTVELALQPLSREGAPFVAEALSAQLFNAAQARHLKAGERLFAIGDPGDGCFLLEQGLLKVTVASPLGEERIIAILGPGAIVGELSMIDGLPRSASVVAMRDCVLRFVSREAFQQRANTKPEIHQLLLAILATRLRQVDEDLVATTFLTVKARVARALLKLAEYIGQPSGEGHFVFQERITLADLAAMAGVARENASRVLSEWRRRKFVTGLHRLCINNIAAIERETDLTDAGHARPRVLASPCRRHI